MVLEHDCCHGKWRQLVCGQAFKEGEGSDLGLFFSAFVEETYIPQKLNSYNSYNKV